MRFRPQRGSKVVQLLAPVEREQQVEQRVVRVVVEAAAVVEAAHRQLLLVPHQGSRMASQT